MYASGVPLASLGLRASVLLFGVAGVGLAALQGGGDVRLWRPSVSLGLHASVLLFGVAGAGLAALQGARCTPLASLWRPLVFAPLCFYLACQARDLLLCQGRDVRLWRPSGVPWSPRLCASIWRGRRGTCCSARGVMYASGVPLASLWHPLVSAPLCFYLAWQARDLLLCKGRDARLASLWRPLVSAPLCFYLAWQARDLLLCQGRDVRLWPPSGVPWSPRLCASIWRGRRGTCCCARGVMYASGVPLASLWRPLVSAPLCFYLAWHAGLAALQGA